MSQSIIYRSPFLYKILIKILYGKEVHERYQAVAQEISKNDSVLDVCCGDHLLYSKYLNKEIDYVGVDISPSFVNYGRKKGVKVLNKDIRKDELPSADVVILQSSLYQFIPDQKVVVDKLLKLSKKKLLISEPIKNLSSSDNPLVSFLAKRAANPGTGNSISRFNLESFKKFLNSFYKNKIKDMKISKGGRDILAVLNP